MLGLNRIKEMDEIRKEIDQVFDRMWSSKSGDRWPLSFLPGSAARRYPKMNLSEDQDKFYVEALAPGIDTKSLKVSVVGNQLMLSGEKTAIGAEVKPDAFHRNERAAGKFVRTVELPAPVKAEKVDAHYRNGILLVVLPKADEAKPKTIEVKVS